jgi:hypothetical protein
MRSIFFRNALLTTCSLLSLSMSLTAQQKTEKKYPALLWEITGNGLKKTLLPLRDHARQQ